MRPTGMLRGSLSSWGRGSRARWVVTALVLTVLGVVGASVALAETTSGGPPTGAGDAQVEAAVGAASLVVSPNALPLLEGGTVLIAGAGLPPGQAVRVSVTDALGIRWDITGSVTPLPLIAGTGGAIVAELAIGRWAIAGIEEPGPITLNLSPIGDFGNVLATAPLILCDPGLAGRTVSLKCEPIATAAAGGSALPVGETHIARSWGLRDGSMELRIGDRDALGHVAGETFRSLEGDIVMTVKLGDTILFNDPGLTSSSRDTAAHNFTIDELGIDVALAIGDRGPSYSFVADQAGTFRVYCSAHPDDHGTATLVVES